MTQTQTDQAPVHHGRCDWCDQPGHARAGCPWIVAASMRTAPVIAPRRDVRIDVPEVW